MKWLELAKVLAGIGRLQAFINGTRETVYRRAFLDAMALEAAQASPDAWVKL